MINTRCNPMLDMCNDFFAAQKETQNIIDNATVYTERVLNTGSYYETRYFGKNKEMVQKYAEDRFNEIDPMRSPIISGIQPYFDMWSVTISYYGLD